ncbi:MAG: hypothetical protein HKN30_09930 [Sulfitobacter sp.]|nr:hypothetical protein [Sulfitobacter sp.]
MRRKAGTDNNLGGGTITLHIGAGNVSSMSINRAGTGAIDSLCIAPPDGRM